MKFITPMLNPLKYVFALLLLATAGIAAAAAQSDSATVAQDSTAADSIAKRKGFIAKVIDYFASSNRTKKNSKFDVSFIGGPHYSSDTGVGIGLVAAGFYRNNPRDTISQPSNVSLYSDIATSGFFLVGLRGDHIFSDDTHRIDYNLYFYSFPRYFWGIGYDMGNDMDNKSKFRELYVNSSIDYLWRVNQHLFLGPAIEFCYTDARRRVRPELWNGQRSHVTTFGVGFRAQLDTRDNFTAPTRGWLFQLEQRFAPRFLGNDNYAFSYTDVRSCFYHHAWRDATVALRLHGRMAYGNVPWNLMSTFGGSSVMRGYYDGRFRDKGEMDFTVELRQHIWHRNGIVLWGGVGTVFPRLSEIQFRRLLPNFGVGYRWEFKKLTNVRIDFGLAKGEHAFIFSINEAF
ncbi:MAG: BamA/TamA family outer membrane protein [Firmicutes bacterium]|nr:BamA/TamA family outer membrane protein [Bacillota bacterium]MCM1401198.1 BamA/TamA family outer membrane protein [Bacteroides sp.]MCM1477105.1 BamA/TamA family outer membrane protein [Bacteroides sp.]